MKELNAEKTPLQARLESLGFSLASDCLDAGGHDKPSKWAITLKRGSAEYTTSYQMGAAYRVASRSVQSMVSGIGILQKTADALRDCWKIGERVPQFTYRGIVPHDQRYLVEHGTKPAAPELADAFACLMLDASTVASGETFEEWARELGEDEDSRKAERSYFACRDTHHKLYHGFGLSAEELAELEELCRDR